MSNLGNLITKIEFHEAKSRHWNTPYVDLYCFVSDLPAFIAGCVGEPEWSKKYGGKEDYEYQLKRLSTSRAKRSHFSFRMGDTSVLVYPKENLITNGSVGLHYICQHLFDFMPQGLKEHFYPSIEPENFVIGKLIVDDRECKCSACAEGIDVKGRDITTGFMLDRKQLDEYKDTFSIWIKHRRLSECFFK